MASRSGMGGDGSHVTLSDLPYLDRPTQAPQVHMLRV